MSSKTRVQMDFPPLAMNRLMRLKARTEATSFVDVTKSAHCLYEEFLDERERAAKSNTRQFLDECIMKYNGLRPDQSVTMQAAELQTLIRLANNELHHLKVLLV